MDALRKLLNEKGWKQFDTTGRCIFGVRRHPFKPNSKTSFKGYQLDIALKAKFTWVVFDASNFEGKEKGEEKIGENLDTVDGHFPITF